MYSQRVVESKCNSILQGCQHSQKCWQIEQYQDLSNSKSIPSLAVYSFFDCNPSLSICAVLGGSAHAFKTASFCQTRSMRFLALALRVVVSFILFHSRPDESCFFTISITLLPQNAPILSFLYSFILELLVNFVIQFPNLFYRNSNPRCILFQVPISFPQPGE